jgi:ferredoxin-NADP reductase
MSRHHPLRVARVDRETADAVTITLDVPDELVEVFGYRAGQFVTLRLLVDDEVVLRSYSMSSAPSCDDELRITVKRVPGGVASNVLNDDVAVGDVLEASAPLGHFVLTDAEDDLVLVAGGSGITPVFSLAKEALHTTSRRIRVLFANPERGAAIFGDALDRLAADHPDRLTVCHHEDAGRGFLTVPDVAAFLGRAEADIYVCGPAGLMALVERSVGDVPVTPDRLHLERFTVPTADPAPVDGDGGGGEVTITLRGRTETVAQRGLSTVLQSARWVGLAAPSSCEAGHCASCMALVVEGRVAMRVNDILTPEEIEEGWVLTCQAVPVTDTVKVVYDP